MALREVQAVIRNEINGLRLKKGSLLQLWSGMILSWSKKEHMKSICLFWILKRRSWQRKWRRWKLEKQICIRKMLLLKKSMKISMNSYSRLIMKSIL